MPLSSDHDKPLTPNHFLLGNDNTSQTPAINNSFAKPCALGKQWLIARQLKDTFWGRWILDYLSTLKREINWCERAKPPFVCDETIWLRRQYPTEQWCRGGVEAIHHGCDDIIRRADVRSSSGILSRLVSKLTVLAME